MGLLLAVASWATPARARAAVVYELSPATSVGATSNVQALSNGQASAFSMVAGVARIASDSPRTRLSASSRVAYTHYFVEGAPGTISGELAGTSAFDLTAALGMNLGAGAMVSRTGLLDTASLVGQAALPGARLYVNSTATQGLGYLATTRLRLSQGLGYNRIDYLGSSSQPTGTPTPGTARPSTALSANLGADYSWTRDSVSLGLSGTDLITGAGIDPFGTPVVGGHTLLGQALVGWRRELSATWASQLQAGMAWMRPPSGKVTPLPAGVATLNYRHLPWYATLMVQHAVVPNLFLGVATVNDQASVSLTLPLDTGERMVLSGTASYARARAADQSDPAQAAYNFNLLSAGSTLSYRFRELPLFGSLTYTVLNQRGTSPVGGALDVTRHTLMVNLTAAFMWGPGTPAVGAGGAI
jgi:hypothetical protein